MQVVTREVSAGPRFAKLSRPTENETGVFHGLCTGWFLKVDVCDE